MRKMRIWIINHYAIPPSMGTLVRHYYFSKYLQEKGHEVKIFTSSKIHNSNINMITDRSNYIEKKVDGIEYTFVRTSDDNGNGVGRIINMFQFAFRIWKVCKFFEKPNVIYASSPCPFAAISAVLMAKFLNVKVVVEVRDLWPESIVEYNNISKNNPLIRILYTLERWLYINADELIFTMPGGQKYIEEKRWNKKVDPKKIHFVDNGVDLNEFEYNREHFQIRDKDLENISIFKVVYTGSVRKVNNIEALVECALLLKKKNSKIKILIWGDGNERHELEEQCASLELDNIVFKGRVEKKYIPYIVSQADVNFIHGKSTNIMRFGWSPNKLFDYLAAGRPILTDIDPYCNEIKQYRCGITVDSNDPKMIVKALLALENGGDQLIREYSTNARELVNVHDYRVLTEKIEKILEEAGKTK